MIFLTISLVILQLSLIQSDEIIENQDIKFEAIVSTALGQIRGSVLTSRKNEEFLAFRGIRYAHPPTKELRFKVRKFEFMKGKINCELF